jgi:hypothetical protein
MKKVLDKTKSFRGPPPQEQAKKEEWLKEYQQGCDWEIYCTPISQVFQGCKFAEMSFLIFEHMQIVVFGLQLHDPQTDARRILLNPGTYFLPREGGYNVQVFVLAKNKAEADQLNNLSQIDELFFATAFHRAASGRSGYGNNLQNVGRSNRAEESGKVSTKTTSNNNITSKNGINDSGTANSSSKPKKKYWKLLKRSNLLQKKIELDSFQEKLQKMEESHMSTYYYHRPTAVSLEDCYIKTSVIDEVNHINNHLIIMGKDLTNVYDLIRPLRAKYLGSLKYIVILYPHDIPYDIWRRICFFDAILVVRGSSLEEIDLRRAGIYRAHQVVVLADASRERSSDSASSKGDSNAKSTSELESLIDSDAIFTYQCVRRLNPHAQIVVEIVNHANIAYLDNNNSGSNSSGSNGTNGNNQTSNNNSNNVKDAQKQVNDYKFTPQFASGSLFTTSLLDSLVCQAFYSPMIIDVVNRLISGIDHLDRGELEAQARAYSRNEDDGQDSSRFSVTDSSGDLLRPQQSSGGMNTNEIPLKQIQGSCLYLINIPDTLVVKTYGSLYKLLAREHKIPMGLLRGTIANLAMGPKANRMPFVYTNPDKDCEVYSCDRVFVLSMEALQANKLAVKDWILDIQMHKKLAAMASTEDTSAKDLAAIRREYRHLQRVQRNLAIKFDGIAESMNTKFDTIMSIVAAGVAERVAQEEEILAKSTVPTIIKNRKTSMFAGNKKEDIARLIQQQWHQQMTAFDDKADADYSELSSRSRSHSVILEEEVEPLSARAATVCDDAAVSRGAQKVAPLEVANSVTVSLSKEPSPTVVAITDSDMNKNSEVSNFVENTDVAGSYDAKFVPQPLYKSVVKNGTAAELFATGKLGELNLEDYELSPARSSGSPQNVNVFSYVKKDGDEEFGVALSGPIPKTSVTSWRPESAPPKTTVTHIGQISSEANDGPSNRKISVRPVSSYGYSKPSNDTSYGDDCRSQGADGLRSNHCNGVLNASPSATPLKFGDTGSSASFKYSGSFETGELSPLSPFNGYGSSGCSITTLRSSFSWSSWNNSSKNSFMEQEDMSPHITIC